MSKSISRKNSISKMLNRIVYTTISLTAFIIFTLLIFSKLSVNLFSSSQVSASGNVTTRVTVYSSICGDDTQEGVEDCDGADLDDQSCSSLGYESGTLECNANCTFNTSNCVLASSDCGNDSQEEEEECDGDDLDSQNCVSLDYIGGYLSCNENCTFDKSQCKLTIDPGEEATNGGEEEEEEEEEEEAEETPKEYIQYKEETYGYSELPEMNKGDNFTIYGYTYPNAVVKVTVYSAVKAYITLANKFGYWYVTVYTDDLEAGDHHAVIEITYDDKIEVDETINFKIDSGFIFSFLPFTGAIAEAGLSRWFWPILIVIVSVIFTIIILIAIKRREKEDKAKKKI